MRWVMMLTYFVAILITLTLMSVYILGVLNESLHSNKSSQLYAKANIISDLISQSANDTERNVYPQVEQIVSGTNVRVITVSPTFSVIYDTAKEASLVGKVLMRDIINTAMGGEQADFLSSTETGTSMMTVAVPITSNGQVSGVVYLAEVLSDTDKIIDHIRVNMIMFSALISILVGMLSVGMSFLVTSPIDDFISIAREISKGNYKMRLNPKGDKQLCELADAMNTMSQALENIDETHKKFISDVSHELKTPLASIKLICDSIVDSPDPDIEMIKEFLADLSNEVDRLTRIVQRLLTLTKIKNEDEQTKFTPVDFGVMLNAIINRLKPNADAKHIILCSDLDMAMELAPILIDYDKIWEAIYNITDNAIKYTPENGSVKLTLGADSAEITVMVSDSGEGIAEEERDRIFDRFYRIDDSRARETGGTGLGLAIAKEAVLLHGGRIEVTESEYGGSIFIIYLPKRFAES